MRASARILVVVALWLAAALAAGSEPVAAQCVITGPATVCAGDTVELCGPTGDGIAWLWQGPDGELLTTQCILATMTGTYYMRVRDASGTWGQPCTFELGPDLGTPPVISGPASTCYGTPVTWSGPAGSYAYDWAGPGGFAANTASVSVSEAGDYRLRVRPLPGGCWSDSAVQALSVSTCDAPDTLTNCPRTAAWWAEHTDRGRDGRALDADVVARIAACVNEQDAYFDWSAPADDFRRVLNARHRSLRESALLQLAAVRANVCGGAIGLAPGRGAEVMLDPSTMLALPGVTGTLAQWMAGADARLASLASRDPRSAATKAAYRALITTAWSINHGIGIGTTCAGLPRPGTGAAPAATAATDADLVADDPEPLATALIDESNGTLSFGELTPNPFTGSTRLAFAVASSGASAVVIGVHDVSGRLVKELARGTYAPGRYEVSWDGRAADGTPVRSGVYFILGRVAGEQVQSRVTLVR